MSGRESVKPDLDSPRQIKAFVESFYDRVLDDPVLVPIFLDVAGIDLDRHLLLIRAYWEKLLLHHPGYDRHTMNVHRALHAREPLLARHFEHWLSLFKETLDERFAGPGSERAWRIAQHVAANMRREFVGRQ